MASDVAQRFVTPVTLLAYRFDIAFLLLIPVIIGIWGVEKFSPAGE